MFMFSCRFETKMRQNAPNHFNFLFSEGNTPGPPPLGLCPRPAGGEGGEGREGQGEGKGSGEKREGGGREGEGEVCVIAVGWGSTPPWF